MRCAPSTATRWRRASTPNCRPGSSPAGHTRLPRYARAKRGRVERDRGVFHFADARADGDDRPQHCYSVRFTARELWGAGAPEHDSLYLELWEDHMDPA